MNCLISCLLWILIPFLTIILYFKHCYQYWANKGVPTPKTSIPFGSLESPLSGKRHLFEQLTDIYRDFKAKGCKYAGFYLLVNANFLPIDIELIKAILGKDFAHFSDRGTYVNEVHDPLSAQLFSLESAKWKPLRAKLTPTFTSGKMKNMFLTLAEVGRQLEKEALRLHDKMEPLDIKEIFSRYSTDIIGSCAFGIDCNSFVDPNSDFRKYGKKSLDFDFGQIFNQTFATTFPNLFRKTGLRVVNKDVTDFFMNLTKSIVTLREEGNTRKDFMQILVDLKNSPGSELTVNEIAAQLFLFFIAGFETSSSTMTFCLFELAKYPKIQEKVRNEIREVLANHQGEITYESLKEMKYLEQALNETLRKYPPLGVLMRKCTKNYHVPGSKLVIDKGMNVFISVHAIHYDPEYYPDPEKFEPDRFSEENKAKRHPFTHLPFGEGPRNCIGLRFGVMQTKLGLALMLKNFKFTVNEKTKLPLTFNPNVFITNTNETIWLDVQKI